MARTGDAVLRSDRTWQTAAWLLLALASIGLARRTAPHLGWYVEDAYISFRYATHLAEGYGLVWNLGGERVEGFTSPLHIWLLALGTGLGVPITVWASALNFTSLAACVLAFVTFLRRRVGRFTPIGAALLFVFLVEDRLAVHTTAGLDTPMYMALLAWNIVLSLRFLEGPSLAAGCALAGIDLLSLLGRPDAAPFVATQGLVLAGIGMRRLTWDRSDPLLRHTLVAFGALSAAGCAYLAWKLVYFGTLLPNPFYIKSNGVALDGLGPVLDFLVSFGPRFGWIVLPALAFLDYRAVGECWRRRGSAFLLILGPSVGFLLYYTTVVHEVSYMHRFEYPVYLPLLMALAWILSVGAPARRAAESLARLLPAAVALGVVGIVSLVLIERAWQATVVGFPWIQINDEGYYRPIGEALADTGIRDQATLVIDSAGVVPFLSQFTHVDPVGLNDNTLSGREPIGVIEREQYIWGRRPDLYIGPYPRASAGATGCTDDPFMQSPFAENVLLAPITDGPYYRHYGSLSREERCSAVHWRMRELRDQFALVGEIPFPVGPSPEYTTFVHVRRDSPYRETLVAAMKPLIVPRPQETHLEPLAEAP